MEAGASAPAFFCFVVHREYRALRPASGDRAVLSLVPVHAAGNTFRNPGFPAPPLFLEGRHGDAKPVAGGPVARGSPGARRRNAGSAPSLTSRCRQAKRQKAHNGWYCRRPDGTTTMLASRCAPALRPSRKSCVLRRRNQNPFSLFSLCLMQAIAWTASGYDCLAWSQGQEPPRSSGKPTSDVTGASVNRDLIVGPHGGACFSFSGLRHGIILVPCQG
jgi:hypothetical protein